MHVSHLLKKNAENFLRKKSYSECGQDKSKSRETRSIIYMALIFKKN